MISHRQDRKIPDFDAALRATPLVPAFCSVDAVVSELERAQSIFPTWPTDPIHAFAVVAEEFGEVQKEVLQLTYEPHKSSRESVRKEAVQLAAMALRFLDSLDRYEYTPCEQHSQNDKAEPPRK